MTIPVLSKLSFLCLEGVRLHRVRSDLPCLRRTERRQ